MNLEFQRKVDRYFGQFICRIFSIINRVCKKAEVKKTPEKILVILISEMGSLVLAHPMFAAIKKKYSHASIHVLVFEKNREILELLPDLPAINILTINNVSLYQFIKDTVKTIFKLRRLKFDIVIDCELFARISSIFSFMANATVRAGFHPYTQEGLYRGNFINRPVLYNPYQHISHQFLNLVNAINSTSVPKVKHKVSDAHEFEIPVINIDQTEIRLMKKRLTENFGTDLSRKIILVNPSGGILSIRAWPINYYFRLAQELISKGYTVGITGLQSDKPLADKIISYCNDENCIDLTGFTKKIREMLVLFKISSLLITNDGGPGHFSALTRTPAIVLYGPETPLLYGTLNKFAVNMYTGLSCSPCLTAYNHRNSPCDGDNQCLKQIAPESVIAKAMGMMTIHTKN